MQLQADKLALDDKVPAVTKAVAIIRYINTAGSGGASLNDIALTLGITKSHCYNILKGLTRQGWLVHDEERRAYALSPRILSDISSIFSRRSLTKAIHDELDSLSRRSGYPCVLTRVERDGSFVAIDRSEAAEELMFSAPIGHRFPPDAPAQMRVRLAWMSEEEREQEIRRWEPKAYTATTIVDKDELRAEIAATRARGYGISRAEFTPGVMTLAVPIFDAFGNVQMILQAPGMMSSVIANERALARELRASAERLNAMSGSAPDADLRQG